MSEPIQVSSFKEIINEQVNEFVKICGVFGDDNMKTLADLTLSVFEEECRFIEKGIACEQPSDDILQGVMAAKLRSHVLEIQNVREAKRGHLMQTGFFNHFSIVAESIPALGWITVQKTPLQLIRDMREAGEYFGIRVLRDKESGCGYHRPFVYKWGAVLMALEQYVRTFHKTGFSWNVLHAHHGVAPPNQLPPPPPPPPDSFAGNEGSRNTMDDNKTALLNSLNQGVDIVRMLKPVRPSGAQQADRPAVQQVKEMGLRSAPVSHPVRTYPAKLALEGRKWLVEYQNNNRGMQINPNDMSESLAMYKCENSAIEIKAKMNAVTIDNCKRCTIFLRDIISSVEMIRCDRVEVKCLGSVPIINLDSCDSVGIFLTDESIGAEVIHSKSSSLNICRLHQDGDYTEYPAPEQIKCVFVDGTLKSSVVQHM